MQDPVTGLLPPTGNQKKLGYRDYPGDAWVRDNVYGSLSLWGLALAYSKNADHDDEKAKTFELKQVKCKLIQLFLVKILWVSINYFFSIETILSRVTCK